MPASGGRAPAYAGGYNPYSPFSWSPERLNTILRYRAGLERSLHRTLKALAERRAARAEEEKCTNEPGAPVPEARPGPAASPRTNEPETGTVGPAAGDAPGDAPRATGAPDAERTNPGRPRPPGENARPRPQRPRHAQRKVAKKRKKARAAAHAKR